LDGFGLHASGTIAPTQLDFDRLGVLFTQTKVNGGGAFARVPGTPIHKGNSLLAVGEFQRSNGTDGRPTGRVGVGMAGALLRFGGSCILRRQYEMECNKRILAGVALAEVVKEDGGFPLIGRDKVEPSIAVDICYP
jgi:hypothetical protein